MEVYHTILLVDNDIEQATELSIFLAKFHYNVLHAPTARSALKIIEKHSDEIHLAALDALLPDADGNSICRFIRKHTRLKHIPILFVSSCTQENNEIEGLKSGADAYITKPVGLKLIKTRIDVLLRRQNPNKTTWLEYGDIYVDLYSKNLFINDDRVALTHTEFYLAELFFKNPGKVFSRQKILNSVFPEDRFVFDRTVDAHIKNLRQKLGDLSNIIRTYRGLGYGLDKSKL
ncbi:response regulator transcription factor [Aliifodinibius sp. S!AR15-10]|uniref:response regulator transcription factor n=1 Tax=Aliifodinibius sp. S!AR15-10 TaxID=2950437 RepID=UPI00285A11CE|nr:response regulator transcription factor [Aliifodinibius sp. S!AR15-10]MDR8389952.1 response regulator transcription factor [Aliifodinibius sp. S!AR15-10]